MENLKERVAGELMVMEPAKFLELFRNILNGFVLGDAKALDIAKRETQKIIDSIKDELSKYDLAQAGIETYAEEPEEVEMGDEVKDDNYYSNLSKREIEKEIDAALDAGDFEKVKMLSKFINESLRVKIAKKLYPDQGYPIFDL
jgi:ribosomal protein S18